jgi:hypothetical protein
LWGSDIQCRSSIRLLHPGTLLWGRQKAKRDPVVLLPLEIIDNICEHLAHLDFKALRFTLWIWQVSADKAPQCQKPQIQLRNGFERLQTISRYLRLRQLVYYIRYDSRRLEHNPEWIRKRVCPTASTCPTTGSHPVSSSSKH